MYGDDPNAEIPEEEKKYSFLHKPVWPRIAIVLAGPLMNLFFAAFVFAIIGLMGERVLGPQLGDIDAESAAYVAGFRSGDTITKVNDRAVVQWSEIKEAIEENAGTPLTFEVLRESTSQKETLTATPVLGKNPFIFSTRREVGQIAGLSTDSIATMIGVSDPNSPAAKAGLKTFDTIEAINGTPVSYWRQLEPQISESIKADSIRLSVRAYPHQAEAASPPELREITIPVVSIKKEKSLLNQLGIMRSDLFLHDIRPGSPAEKAGLMRGDRVARLDGEMVTSWQTVLSRIKNYTPADGAVQFSVLRNGEVHSFSITPEEFDLPTDQGAIEKRYAIGVVPGIMVAPATSYFQKSTNPFSAAAYGASQSWLWTKLTAISFVRLVQNEVSPRNIGGVITIGRVASKSYEAGWVAFLKMMGIISINLFLLNLLPVPVLDGGHLVFFTIEAVKGAPLSFRKLEIAQQVGLVLLLSLMLFALFNDITHLMSSW